jgi:hypothetical protein
MQEVKVVIVNPPSEEEVKRQTKALTFFCITITAKPPKKKNALNKTRTFFFNLCNFAKHL